MFISQAYAQDAAGAGGGSFILQFAPLILIFVVFYFLLIRPQQKRMRDHREMLSAVRRGDRVVTGGGIIGVVTKAGGDELTIEIAQGVRVKVMRGTVSSVLQKTEPARSRDEEDDEDADDDGDIGPGEDDTPEEAPRDPTVARRRGGLSKALSKR